MNLLTVVSVSLIVSSVAALVLNRRLLGIVRESWRRELEMASALDAVGKALHAPRHLVVYELRMALIESQQRMQRELEAQNRPRRIWELPPKPGEDWPSCRR